MRINMIKAIITPALPRMHNTLTITSQRRVCTLANMFVMLNYETNSRKISIMLGSCSVMSILNVKRFKDC